MEFCTAVKKNVTLCVHSPGTISKINEVNKKGCRRIYETYCSFVLKKKVFIRICYICTEYLQKA